MSFSQPNRLFLVRHGENTANLTLEFSHRRVDYSLTPKGVLQAQQTAAYLSDKGIQEIYTSPLKRAAETAALIAEPYGLPVTALENFREINVGDFEGQPPTADLWARHNAILRDWFDGRPESGFPGGEDLNTLAARGLDGLRRVLEGKAGRKILIVAHGGILIFTLQGLLGGDARDTLLRQGMANCGVTELEACLDNDQVSLRVLSYNSTGHLSGQAANLITGVLGEGGLKKTK